jgi:DNA-binding transcriptional LysR family regulator
MNFRTLDLNLLRVFDEVMAERSLTRAARNLAMTQPAASNALRRLRDAFGDELLVRAGQGVQPTPFAQALWPTVRDALSQLRAAIAPSEFDPADSRSTFELAMADATAALLIPSLLARIEKAAPGVSLRVLPLTTRDPRQMLETSEVDAAIGYFPAAMAAIALSAMQQDTPDNFGHERLYGGDYVCVMRRDHPLAEQPLTLDAYCDARHLLVSFSGRPYGFIDEALAAHGRRRRVVLTVNQFFTAGQVVAQSSLLSIFPRHFVQSTGSADLLVERPLPITLPRVHVDMLWHRRHDSREDHGWLRAQVLDAARESEHAESRYQPEVEPAAS